MAKVLGFRRLAKVLHYIKFSHLYNATSIWQLR